MKKFGKLAVLVALVLAAACFVSCSNSAGGSSSSSSGVMTTSVELTGTTDPVFENGTKTCTRKSSDGSTKCEATISGTTANLKWVAANKYGLTGFDIYEKGDTNKMVGQVWVNRTADKNRNEIFTAEWKYLGDKD